jgi:hypothetical protein
VTFAEFRDRRKIFDIEAYSRQPIKAETVVGLEPKQRFPDARPASNFGGRNTRGGSEGPSRDRKFGAPREGSPYERKGGFNDRFNERSNDRPSFHAPHDKPMSARPAFGKPSGFAKPGGFAKPAPSGKSFVPRDAKKRTVRSFD